MVNKKYKHRNKYIYMYIFIFHKFLIVDNITFYNVVTANYLHKIISIYQYNNVNILNAPKTVSTNVKSMIRS